MTTGAPFDLVSTSPFQYVIYPSVREPAHGPESINLLRRTKSAAQVFSQSVSAIPLAGLSLADAQAYSVSDFDYLYFPEALEPKTEDLPVWAPDALAELLTQYSRKANWDSYGALPLDEHLAAVAWRFLEDVMTPALPLPDFVPLPDGGLQLEWDFGDAHLSYTADSDGAPELWLSTPEGDRQLGFDDLGEVLREVERTLHS